MESIEYIRVQYQELRKIRLDQITCKLAAIETFIKDMEDEVQAHSTKMLDLATLDNDEATYNTISDQYAESMAGLRAAKEALRAAMFHAAQSMYHGAPANLINVGAIEHENQGL
ncbi:hypothetical protein LNS06_004233 [Salmonella enterica]|nr:hypothetical protein [Salmonella enterica]